MGIEVFQFMLHHMGSLISIIVHSLGERQVVNLVKIAAFCRDTNLVEAQQADMKRQCLSYWEVPDKVRTAPPRVAPEAKCDEILKKIKAGTSGGREFSC
jgi:cap1 methyltransferase